jgi:hypothetical protein
VVFALTVAACASQATPGGPTSGDSPSATSLPQITVHRGGGLAGVDDTLSVDAKGGWSTSGRTGRPRTGQLSADQVVAVRTLATNPQLATEARRPTVETKCRDAFEYGVTVGALHINYTDCPTDSGLPAATMALVRQLPQLTA